MEIKKTGKLFSFCCMVPAIIKNRDIKVINHLKKIGSLIGLLFQIVDDLIDYEDLTKKDQKKGKATLVNLLGYKNAIKYSNKIKSIIINDLNKYGSRSKNIKETLNYILTRKK